MLTSLQNPIVKQMRKLHRSKERRKQNLFLLEGTHLLESACQENYSLETVCFTSQWQSRHPKLWEEVQQNAQRTEEVTLEIIRAIATTVNPEGIVATVSRNLSKSSPKEDLTLGLMLERLQDPGNLGTIIRTATAANVDQLWLSLDSVDLDNPKVLRASSGAWFRLPMTVDEDLRVVVKQYQSQGVQIIATCPQAPQLYWEIDWCHPTIILLGNEGAGLSENLVSIADQTVKIPLSGGVESLNVAMASGLLLYEAKRQRQKQSS